MECCRNVRIFIHLPFSKYFRLNFLCVLSSNLTSFDTIFLNYIKNGNVIFKRKILSWYGYLQLLLLRNLCHFYILFILCHSCISTALTLCKLDTSVPIWCIFYDLTDLRNIALSGSIGVYYWSTDLHKISLLKNPDNTRNNHDHLETTRSCHLVRLWNNQLCMQRVKCCPSILFVTNFVFACLQIIETKIQLYCTLFYK